jgi:hypothetical protein
VAGGFEAGGSGLGTRLCPKGQSQQARALGGARTVPNPLDRADVAADWSATPPRSDGARCSYSLIENEFGIPDYEPVTLLWSPAAVPEGDCWFQIGKAPSRVASQPSFTVDLGHR